MSEGDQYYEKGMKVKQERNMNPAGPGNVRTFKQCDQGKPHWEDDIGANT